MSLAKRSPKGERAALGRIRRHALKALHQEAEEHDFRRDWLEGRRALYEGSLEEALRLFHEELDGRYLDVGSAMALAMIDAEKAEAAFRRIGFWIEGGSLEGHRLAGHAFLPRYPLKVHELFGGFRDDPDRTLRVRAAAKCANKEQRLAMLASLAVDQGRLALAYKQVKAGHRDARAAEIALACGDLETAAGVFGAYRRSATSSWFAPSGDANKAIGFAGSAAVAHAEGQYTQAIANANKALKLASKGSRTHTAALLVRWAAEIELGLDGTTHRALRRATKLDDFRFGHLALSDLEEEQGMVDAKRVAADEGDALWGAPIGTPAEDRAAAARLYARALGVRGRRVRKSMRLGGRRDRIAARLLYALCEQGELERAEAIAQACIVGAPDFQNAWEVAAWCAGHRRAPSAKAVFAAAGLRGERSAGAVHRKTVTLARWLRRPLERALRQEPKSRSAHGGELVYDGLFDAALSLFEATPLAKDAESRFLAAWACWVPMRDARGECPTGHRYGRRERQAAQRAWKLLEPLIVARWDTFYQRQPFDPWLLAVELLHADRCWGRLLEVHTQATEEHWTSSFYREVGVGLAPFAADAMAETRGADAALAYLGEQLERDPRDRRLLEASDAIARRSRKTQPSLAKAAYAPAARARELAFRAWREETTGALEEALATYRESSSFEMDPMGLSNAANLLGRAGAIRRSNAYFEVALIRCGEVHPRFRAGLFLSKLAWAKWLQDEPADAIPLAVHAFELHPNPDAAHTLALCYRAIGDGARAQRWLTVALNLDSRHAPSLDMRDEASLTD